MNAKANIWKHQAKVEKQEIIKGILAAPIGVVIFFEVMAMAFLLQ